MSATPISGAADLMREVNTFNAKVAAGIEKLNAIKDDQVEIATAAKDEIFRTDKVTLYRYRPLTEVAVPYADAHRLQPDRPANDD